MISSLRFKAGAGVCLGGGKTLIVVDPILSDLFQLTRHFTLVLVVVIAHCRHSLMVIKAFDDEVICCLYY